MGKTLMEIENDIKELTISDKEILVDELLLELDPAPRPEIERLKLELIQHRYTDVMEGRVKGIDGDVVVDRIRTRLNEKT